MIIMIHREFLDMLYLRSGVVMLKTWVWAIAVIGFLSGISVAGAAAPVDLRILIDTSGSMRRTDPLNLRIPALRLVAGLLPRGSHAGIYTFDQRVVTIIPPGEVNAAWQAKARNAADRINSRGLFTDIGAALEQSMSGWDGPSGGMQRKILLMTDGMVDISKDAAVNAAARERVLIQTLPRIRAAGASIYTIALSDEADHDLLRQFARDSNGWSEQAADAGLLQRLFLRIFNQAVQRDTLPLKDNRFMVDSTVHELTLVVFRRPGANPTSIVSPEGTRYSRETPPAQGRWAGEQDYDMVTVEKPVPGSWQVQADTDPDNRVMVVTDLNLEMDPVPPQALVGEHLDLTARLRERGKIVTDHDFLGLLSFSVTRTAENGDHDLRPLRDDGVTPDATIGDGIFSVSLDDLLRTGPQELRVTVEGATFQRELHYSIQLYPAGVETKLEEAEGGGARSVVVRPVPEVVDPGSLAVTATLTDPAGAAQPLALVRRQDGVWSAPLPAGEGHYVVLFQARGRTPQGRALSFIPPPLTFGTGVPVVATPAPTPVPVAPPSHPTAPPPHIAEPVSSPTSWTTLGIVLVSVNALIALAIWFGRRWWQRRNEAMFLDLAEQIEPPTIPL
ncbi:VWFA domain-containing protein [Gammaproteobacteria bacterium]